MHPGVKWALIGTGVVVGGVVLYKVGSMMLAPSAPELPVSPIPSVPASEYPDRNRSGESDVTAVSRVFERAIGAASEGYRTYTTEVAATNRANAARAATQRVDDAARTAKLRAAGGTR
jgi:hypothetical protein